MIPKNRAMELINEWHPSLKNAPEMVQQSYEEWKAILKQQLEAEFKHVIDLAYQNGYNACTKENNSFPQNFAEVKNTGT